MTRSIANRRLGLRADICGVGLRKFRPELFQMLSRRYSTLVMGSIQVAGISSRRRLGDLEAPLRSPIKGQTGRT